MDDEPAPPADVGTLTAVTPHLPELPPGPLSLEAARRLGLSDHQWRLERLHRVTEGVRALVCPDTVTERARAFALALPDDAVFSHVSAAQLWGLPLPERLAARESLDVMRRTGRPPVERTGCVPHRGAERREVVLHRDLRITSLADTWVDLGSLTPDGLTRDDLVVLGDEIVLRCPEPRPGTPPSPLGPSALRTALDHRVRPRGKVVLEKALTLVRPGVRSPMETRARLVFHDAGFPEPSVNAPLTTPDGGWLADGDLVWHEQRVVGEYQGAPHADRRRRSADADRTGILADWGWTVLEIFAEDLFVESRRVRTLHRFARALGIDASGLSIA